MAVEGALMRLDKAMAKNTLSLPQLFHLHTLHSKNMFTRTKMANYEALFENFIMLYKADDRSETYLK